MRQNLMIVPEQIKMIGVPDEPHKNETLAEAMRDESIQIDKKLKTIGTICGFVTLNSISKNDLHEMLKFVYGLLKRT